MIAPCRALPRLDDVRSTFQNHYRYYLGAASHRTGSSFAVVALWPRDLGAGRSGLALIASVATP